MMYGKIVRYLGLFFTLVLTSFNFENNTLVQFSGSNQETINIGLLVSEPALKSEIAAAAVNAAELAINQANSESSHKNLKYHLIVKSCDGPWGAGSKAAVDLVFQDKVCAILTSLDGRNGHLAEQVIAKTKVAMIAARETDPTLTQAFVPWYFRCIPDDRQQADALTYEIFIKRRKSKTVVIYDDSYDSKMTADTYLKKMNSSGAPKPIQIIFKNFQPQYNEVLKQVEEAKIKDIALICQPQHSSKIMELINPLKPNVFGTLTVLGENITLFNSLKNFDNQVLVSSNHWFSDDGLSFQKTYNEKYGYQPGSIAAYAFDGMNVIIDVIKKVGSDRDKIIEELKKINYRGITGNIKFDDKGNRTDNVSFMKIENGMIVPN